MKIKPVGVTGTGQVLTTKDLIKQAKDDPMRGLTEVTTDNFQEPLIVSTFGPPGAGKSRLAGTMPGTIGFLATEHKARQSFLKSAAENARKVIMPCDDDGAPIDFVRVSNALELSMLPLACITADTLDGNYSDKSKEAEFRMQAISRKLTVNQASPDCCSLHHYRWHINRTKYYLFKMANAPGVRSLAIDSFSQYVEDSLYANFGRTSQIPGLSRIPFNQEIRDVFNSISHLNILLTHHAGQIWVGSKPTDRLKPKNSFSELGHYVSVEVEQSINDAPNASPRFSLTVRDCQANAELIGQELLHDDEVTFMNLGMLVYPDCDPAVFE